MEKQQIHPRRKAGRWLLPVLFVLLCFSVRGQTNKVITLDMKNAKRADVLNAIKKQVDMEFFYNVDELNKHPRITISAKAKPLAEVLDQVLAGTSLKFVIEKNVVIISPQKPFQAGSSATVEQLITIKGKITGPNAQPLVGVTILEEATGRATTSNANGDYTIGVKKNARLRFSYIGMKSIQVGVTVEGVNNFTQNIRLQPELIEMSNIVVTGYQNIARRDMVGAASTVKGEDIKIAGINNIDRLLQGQLPGVAVTTPSGLVGARPKVRVRGTSTLLGNQEPVWVVDGIIQEDPIPFDYKRLNDNFLSEGSTDAIRNLIGSSVAFLNVEDIQDVTVLKDAASTAIYGVKAANGVIVITTKKGRAGKTTVNYATNFTVSARPSYDMFKLMNSKERIDVSREIYDRGFLFDISPDNISYEGLIKQLFDKKITQEQFLSQVGKLETMNTDWFNLLFQAPVSQNHTVSLSGGSDKTTYYASVGFSDQRGNTKGNQQDRYTTNLRINSYLTNQLRVGFKMSGSFSKSTGFYQVDPFRYAFTTTRALPAYDEGNLPYRYISRNRGSGSFRYNILDELSYTGNTNKVNDFDAMLDLDYKFLNHFTFQSIAGFGYTQTLGDTWASERSNYITQKRTYEYGSVLPNTPDYLKSPLPVGGVLNSLSSNIRSVTFRNTLTYSTKLRDNKDAFSVMVGEETRSSKYDGLSQTNYGYMPDRGRSFAQVPPTTVSGGFTNTNQILTEMLPAITDRLSNFLSFFGTATYNWNQKYVLNMNVRTDASNRFGQNTNHRFLPVWSIGGKWNVAEEGWFSNFYWLNQFSIRATYGFQGNVAENYSPDLIAQIPTGSAGSSSVSGEPILKIKSLAYQDLRWEKNKSINLGLDFSFLNNRISGSVDFYYKKGIDIIIERQIPLEYGIATMPINGGDMENRGYELSLNFIPVRTPDFSWSVSFNTARNFNEITNSGNALKNLWRAAVSGGLYKDGLPASSFWSFDFAGLDPNTGLPTYNRLSTTEDPKRLTDITLAMVHSGQLDPKFTGGLGNNFRYKNINLSMFFNISLGNHKRLPDLYENMTTSAPYPYLNISSELTGRWRQPGDEKFTNIPVLPTAGVPRIAVPVNFVISPYEMYDLSAARIVNASYIRCQNLALNYMVPQQSIKRFGLKQLTVTGSVTNLFYIASEDLHGQDPEVSGNSLPIPRTFSLSLNVGL